MSSAYLDKNHKIYHTGDGQVVRPGPRSFPFSSALYEGSECGAN